MSMPNREKPAFPPNGGWRDNDPLSRGLTKREHFAAMAMQGLLSDGEGFEKFADVRDLADLSVAAADALIEALEGQS